MQLQRCFTLLMACESLLTDSTTRLDHDILQHYCQICHSPFRRLHRTARYTNQHNTPAGMQIKASLAICMATVASASAYDPRPVINTSSGQPGSQPARFCSASNVPCGEKNLFVSDFCTFAQQLGNTGSFEDCCRQNCPRKCSTINVPCNEMDPDASSVCNASRDLRVGFKSCCLHQCASAVIPIGYKCSDANVACGPRNEDASRSCNSLPTSLGDFQACCMKNC